MLKSPLFDEEEMENDSVFIQNLQNFKDSNEIKERLDNELQTFKLYEQRMMNTRKGSTDSDSLLIDDLPKEIFSMISL